MSMFGGASERLAFLLDLDAGGAIQGFRQVGQEADRSLGKTDDRLNRLGGRMQVAGAGAVAFAGVAGRALYSLAEASEEAHRSELLLQNTYANAPQLAGESAQAIIDLAAAIQKKTAADGDQIIAGAAVLGQYGAEQAEILGLTPLVVDLARKKGVDLVAANTAVGKALDGNRGALARMGVAIDETAFATDHYTAIQDALTESVGGFAEEEGQTFSGQIERMKNQMGDLAEGVGVGVVDAFGDMFGAVGGASDALSGMDANTQATIGRVGAYATAAVGAAGATSFLIGSVIKARDNFASLSQGISGLTTKAGGLGGVAAKAGPAAAAVALFGIAMHDAGQDAAELAEANKRLADDIRTTGDLATAVGRAFERGDLFDELGVSASELTGMFEDLGITLDDVFVNRSYEGGALGDLARSAGFTEEEVLKLVTAVETVDGRIFDAQAEAKIAAAALDGLATSTGDATEATEESAVAHQTAAEAVREHEEGIRGITDAMQDYIDEALTSLDLTADWEAALDGLTESVREHGATLNLDTEAGRENYQQGREVADGLVALMQQRFEETQSIQAAIDAGNLYVEQLKIQLRQAGLTEDEVNNYVNTLRLVPRDIATNFRANTAEAVRQIQELQRLAAGVGANSYEVDFHSRRPGARASGGPVSANTPYIVGEQGPELFVPGSSGSVVPNHALGGGQTVIVLQVDRHVLGSVVVDSLGAYESTNGPIPVRVRG